MERRVVSSVSTTTTIVLLFLQATCTAFPVRDCPASSCGNILNISHPFRLTDDPPGCGDKRYQLDCENNATILTLFSGKYHVHHIDYKGYKIRVSDVGVMEDATCSFIPRYFFFRLNFSNVFVGPATDPLYLDRFDAPRIAYFNCANPITDDPRYVGVDTTRCGSEGYVYAVLEDSSEGEFSVKDIKVGCQLKVATYVNAELVQQHCRRKRNNLSYDDIHSTLAYGFRLSWLYVICEDQCGKGAYCHVINGSTGEVQCDDHSQQNCRLVWNDYAGPNRLIASYECGNKISLALTYVLIQFFLFFFLIAFSLLFIPTVTLVNYTA